MSDSCRVDGCGRDAMYKAVRLCQKHYFRVMRGGTTDLRRAPPKYRLVNPAGYQKIRHLGHALADRQGYVYEHRFVLYSEFGEDVPPCELCGKQLTWSTCHVDHIDNDPTNNERENLRQTCNWCNVRRGRRPECEYLNATKVTIDGVSMTPNEWARQPGVALTGSQIRIRKRMGASDYDAVYGPKKTHNGKGKKKNRKSQTSDSRKQRETL